MKHMENIGARRGLLFLFVKKKEKIKIQHQHHKKTNSAKNYIKFNSMHYDKNEIVQKKPLEIVLEIATKFILVFN